MTEVALRKAAGGESLKSKLIVGWVAFAVVLFVATAATYQRKILYGYLAIFVFLFTGLMVYVLRRDGTDDLFLSERRLQVATAGIVMAVVATLLTRDKDIGISQRLWEVAAATLLAASGQLMAARESLALKKRKKKKKIK